MQQAVSHGVRTLKRRDLLVVRIVVRVRIAVDGLGGIHDGALVELLHLGHKPLRVPVVISKSGVLSRLLATRRVYRRRDRGREVLVEELDVGVANQTAARERQGDREVAG